MLFLLDTNAVSDFMNENPRLATKLAGVSPSDRVITCVVVRGEVLFGIERLPAGRRRDLLRAKADKAFAGMPCEAVPEAASDHYARLKVRCKQAGVALDENDFWIAATAIVLGAVLVTRDADFGRVNGPTTEDWTV